MGALMRPKCILLALCVYTLDASAAPDAGVDAPVMRYSKPSTINGELQPPGYYFPETQYEKVNEEVKRLQRVEQEHVNEASGWTSALVGLVIGIAIGVGVALSVKRD